MSDPKDVYNPYAEDVDRLEFERELEETMKQLEELEETVDEDDVEDLR